MQVLKLVNCGLSNKAEEISLPHFFSTLSPLRSFNFPRASHNRSNAMIRECFFLSNNCSTFLSHVCFLFCRRQCTVTLDIQCCPNNLGWRASPFALMPSTFIRCNLRLVYALDIIIGIGIRKWVQHIGTQGVQE